MKTIGKLLRCMPVLICLTLLIMLSPSHAVMNDYCINPPFIVGGVVPNLLLMLDNSSSMFDLNYVDKGGGTCSITVATKCTDNYDCPSGQTCIHSDAVRKSYYCYDKTYRSAATYVGYFDRDTYYDYDLVNNYFISAAFPGSCDVYVPNTLCMNGTNLTNTTTPKTLTKLAAKGNYLNWLTASKFDVEKLILTGGKYVDKICDDLITACVTDADCSGGTCSDVTNFLQPETRGCVGQKFIKEPNTGNYTEGGADAPLGVTFAVTGPAPKYNETGLSPGGQTYLEIYGGNYSAELCQAAIDAITSDANKQTVTDKIALCLNYTGNKTCSISGAACTNDNDCPNTAGVCNVPADGVCSTTTAGTCSLPNNGVCTVNNGTCTGARRCYGGNKDGAACNNDNNCPQGGVCRRQCVGGGKAGAQCTVLADCAYRSCTAGKPAGTPCTDNPSCNSGSGTCTAGKPIGTACTANPDCDVKGCTAGKPNGTACSVNPDCNSGLGNCSAGLPPATVCSTNANCDNLTGTCIGDATTQIKSTFGQNMHSCYQFRVKGAEPNANDVNQISNPAGCNLIYRDVKVCSGGSADGKKCTTLADCPGGTVCRGGPDTIKPGNPVLICSQTYGGYCADDGPVYDNWATTTWVKREYADPDACVMAMYKKFCGDLDVPPVVDPTDDPSVTTTYENLPAILSGIGVESQLGFPIKTIPVAIKKDTTPTGLLNEYSKQIRFGIMIFNYDGSASECPGSMPCPMKCSVSTNLTCRTYVDCPAGETCIATTPSENRDGAKIDFYIGDPGYCSVATTQSCTLDSNCPGGQTCISVGNHNYGLINSVDKIRGSSWTPFSEAFYNAIGYYARTNAYTISPGISRTALRLNAADFFENKNPSQYYCQKNNILLITDGSSTADVQTDTVTLATRYVSPADRAPAGQVGVCGNYKGSKNLDDIAWVAKHRDIKTFSPTSTDPKPASALKNSEMIDTYVVFTGADNGLTGECNSLTMMNNTAAAGGTTEAKMAEDPEKLYNALKESFQTIASGAGSGTAASVLASGEGSGANLIQALFYTTRDTFGTTVIDPPIKWTGTLKNLWYYIDPFIGNSTIREDAAVKDYTLAINTDKIVNFRFTGDKTVVDLYADANGDGVKDSATPSPADVPFEDVSSLWEAGALLWNRPASDRKIYTYDGTSLIELPNTISVGSPLISLLQAVNADEATAIARYVKGEDVLVCSISKKTCNTVADCTPVVAGETCDAYRSRTVDSKVWKLGDIINSTPRIASWTPQNLYHKAYLDGEYRKFIESDDYGKRGLVFTGANDGMFHAFYLGQLELFSEKFKKATLADPYVIGLGKELWSYIPRNALPYLRYLADEDYCHIYYADATPYIFDASINSPAGCGGDYWDCPKQTKCGANADCTTVNNTLDMANTSWRTVIIGSMRLGGGCKDPASASTLGVKTPLAGEGYSSYFALDITDNLAHPEASSSHPPVLLWEFSNANIPAPELATGGLGFSTTGPAVLRVAPKIGDTDLSGTEDGKDNADNNKNGRFYVVIGSGPTGPIDTNQFRSYSDQPLKLFVLDLKTGALLKTFNETDFGIKNAFAGSMVNSMVDLDQGNPSTAGFYQDDAIYFGYTKAEEDPLTASTKWNRGGIMRLFTKHELDPDLWTVSKVMNDPLGPASKDNIVGPVTAAVNRLQNYTKKTLRLFFGSGRYSYKISSDIDDDNPKDSSNIDIPRRLFGVIEPCFDTTSGAIDFTCSSTVSIGSLSEAATDVGTSDAEGWYINLDICTEQDGVSPIPCYTTDALGNTIPNLGAIYKAERSVTDIAATPMGAVFFTTTKPSADVCAFGGGTHLWAVQYDTGGEVKSGVLRGKAIVQVSTGEIREVDLKLAFTEKDGRRTDVIPGVPPAGPPPGLIVPPQPANKVIHIRER